MNHRIQRNRAAMFVLVLWLGLAGSPGFAARTQQKQAALNRQLIDALVNFDDKRALALVNAGADPNTRYELTPVPSRSKQVKHPRQSSHPTVIFDQHPTAFMIACGAERRDNLHGGHLQISLADAPQLVQSMLAHGAAVNAEDKCGRTPLLCAVCGSRSNTVRLLPERSVDSNADGGMPLRMAVGFETMMWPDAADIIGQLLAHGADPNLADNGGATPLSFAQQESCPDIVALLKHAGARE